MNQIDQSILESLNNITNKTIRRRITRELQDLLPILEDKKLHIEPIQLDEKNLPIVTIVDYNHPVYICQFYIGDCYPFRNPKIKVNHHDYSTFLRINTTRFSQLLKKLKGKTCLCCESYLCGDRWTPAIKLIDIVNEIRTIGEYKRDIINKHYADKIKTKYLVEDIDLDSWLF